MSSSASREKGKKIRLRSSDGKEFVVEPAVAELSGTIKLLMDDGFDDIPLPNVKGKVLAQVIEYSTKHAEPAVGSEASKLKEWDQNFIAGVNKRSLFSCFRSWEEPLFALTRAAHYLDIPGLLDLTAQTIAELVTKKRMSVRELRWTFNVKNDYTRQEEEEARKQQGWAFKDFIFFKLKFRQVGLNSGALDGIEFCSPPKLNFAISARSSN